jgi:tetratricopeptide (TPR) repeat protein
MNILNRFSETRLASFAETSFARFHLPAAMLIGALLLSIGAEADELQDATQLFKQGQQSQALSKLNSYLSNKPRDAQGRFLKGLIFTEQNKIADAIKVFSDLTQDFPELPEPYNNLAVLYASQGQYDKAKSALEMAIRTHPSYATAHENLGDIYAKMASQAYNRALQLDSSNTTTQTKLAMIQDLFSDKPHAKLAGQRNPAIAGKPVAAVEAPKPVAAPAVTAAKTPAATMAKVPAVTTAKAPVVTTAKAPVVTMAKAPAKTVVVAAPSASDHAVQKTVEAWADAWSSKNVNKYLSYYSADFKTPDGESRSAWAASRRDRISKPKQIEVSVSDVSVDFTDNTHATVKFHQNYRASNFKAAGGKTLLMVKSGNSWFIQEERAH